MNYLEEQRDGEAMINSIKNGDQPLPRVTQVSIARTTSTEQPPLKDKSMCNKTAKDLWDALARHILGSEHGDQDRKAAEKYAKLEAERYEYMIRYSAYFDNDKQHRKQIADQQVLYDNDKMMVYEVTNP
nr:hypothetical protein [Tanacetum cinerariifolium]